MTKKNNTSGTIKNIKYSFTCYQGKVKDKNVMSTINYNKSILWAMSPGRLRAPSLSKQAKK